MDELKVMVATTALKDMLQKGWFSICTIDSINKVTKHIPDREAYDMLHALHCVHFSDMPPELVRGMPLLIHRALGTNTIQFDYREFANQLRLKS